MFFNKKKNKIVCIIWGTKEKIIETFNKLHINSIENDEGIAGLTGISFEDVKKIAKIIE